MRTRNQERPISTALRFGVGASTLIIIAGLVVTVAEGGPQQIPGTGFSLTRLFGEIFQDTSVLLHGTTLLYFGLTILTLTPLFRVLTTVVIFIRDKDWRFLSVSLLVSGVIIAELVLTVL